MIEPSKRSAHPPYAENLCLTTVFGGLDLQVQEISFSVQTIGKRAVFTFPYFRLETGENANYISSSFWMDDRFLPYKDPYPWIDRWTVEPIPVINNSTLTEGQMWVHADTGEMRIYHTGGFANRVAGPFDPEGLAGTPTVSVNYQVNVPEKYSDL